MCKYTVYQKVHITQSPAVQFYFFSDHLGDRIQSYLVPIPTSTIIYDIIIVRKKNYRN